MSFSTLMRAGTIENLRFIHRGVIQPKSGIGHHMHNSTEEMFAIFDGAAQFTINGHTAAADGPVGVPVRLGQSQALYNAGDTPITCCYRQVRVSASISTTASKSSTT